MHQKETRKHMIPQQTVGLNSYKPSSDSNLLTGEGVMVVTMRGLVTPMALDGVMHDLRTTSRDQARAFCLHADTAVLAISADYLDAVQPASLSTMSGALVVDVGMVEMARSYARRLAHLGIVRKVFTSRVKAMAWASDQARLALAQARWEMADYPVQ
jgi:hypothetical protein